MIRIAGPSGPSAKLLEDVQKVLDAPQEDIKRFVQWLAAPEHPLPSGWRDLAPIADELNVSRELLNDHFGVIQFIVANWRAEGLSREELLADLAELGISNEQLPHASEIFAQLEGSKERFYIASLRARSELVGGITLDDVSAIWDVRPVFEDSPFSVDDEFLSRDKWLTNTYLLLLELSYSSRSGSKKTVSLQLSEADLQRIESSLERAKSQLQTIKRKQFV